ncbi:hypothetical protein PIB30_037180 [Stylosanthes scabra]|uniref:Transposase MuDR plant domain-containing protein n=1 Tax=Stylosanthes scabra TaxID=79078 RepID=A0ABU6VC63_9FABA|nr:hypothetical protein [Stylosanthes scabra]
MLGVAGSKRMSDVDLEVIFHYRRDFSEVRTIELYVKLENIVASSGGSNPIPTSVHIGGSSSSAPAAPVVPVIPPFTTVANIQHNVPRRVQISDPEGVEEALCDDEEDEEPKFIGGNSDDDHPSVPAERSGPSSSGSHQYPAHFSALNLEAMEDDVLNVKSYSIRCEVDYKVKESNHAKYHARCKNFGSGCEWLIRVALRTRKGFWEVKMYNGVHTCLATEVEVG